MTELAWNKPRTIYLLKAAEVAVRVVADPALRGFGLTMVQYTVLALVEGRDDLSSADLARRLRVTPQSINEVIVRLEQLELVVRDHDPGNRRILRLSISEAGRAMLARCDQAVDAVERRLLERFTRAELEELRAALGAIAHFARDATPAGDTGPRKASASKAGNNP